MSRSTLFLMGIAGVIAAAIAACSASGDPTEFGVGGADAAGTSGKGGASSVNASASGDEIATVSGAGGSTGAGSDCDSGPTEDRDKDGFTVADGDCDDCEANINPNAIDTPATATPDAGTLPAANNNCDDKLTVDETCDDSLVLGDVDPKDGAKAIDICKTSTATNDWGLVSAKYISADGKSPRTPGLQVGIRSTFGPNVKNRFGKAMLGLSSGHMRVPGESGVCTTQSCTATSLAKAPTGFPQSVPGCPVSPDIRDDIALELSLRAPSNATGYKFNFKFYSYEYAEWVCSAFNDQFVALVNPPPMGALNGNISFDSKNNPVSVNIAFFDVCDPAKKDQFGYQSCAQQGSCPVAPSPYCPKGIGELTGTGMAGATSDPGDGGGTSWLETTAPIGGGEQFTIRFTIWDTGDGNLDSHVLIDGFKWIATPGVKVGTGEPPS
jgi:hypothetical protein